MVFRGNQRQSKPLSGTQRSPGPKTVTMTQDCQRHLWWRDGGARARALACCAIVVRSSRPPSLSPLTILAPPPSFFECPRHSMASRRPTPPPSPIATPR